jgi:hypothetical protein
MNYGDGANHQLLELGSVIIDENGARFGSRYTVGWVYADGDTDLVGRVQFLIFETALRKGWNQVVFEATSDGDLTLVTAAAAPEETQWIVW